MSRPFCWFLGLLSISAAWTPHAHGQSKTDQAALERFLRLTPQERRQTVERANQAVWHTVAKGDVLAQLIERGTLEAVQVSDLICRVKSKDTVIKWVIDDGTMVKAGDKILEFDDGAIRERIKEQKLQVELATVQHEQATQSVALAQREGRLAVREAEADIAAAERELKADNGADAVRKDAVELRLERARVALERAKLMTAKQEFRAQGELREKSALLQQEKARLESLQQDLHNCVVHAPQDGILVYYVPESSRFGAGPGAIVAVGEPVREGQKMLRVADLRRMAVQLHVHEAQVSRLQKGMPVTVRVDAFPKEVLNGTVAQVANVPTQSRWMKEDVKVYRTTIVLDGEHKRLKPGMSAEVSVMLDRRPGVLWLPVAAVLGQGKDRFCFVREGKDALAKRSVTLGASGQLTVEVREGLREGDQVLVNVTELVRLLVITSPQKN